LLGEEAIKEGQLLFLVYAIRNQNIDR
jgi:hypothetical protein